MKIVFCIFLTLCVISKTYSQKYDLIVKSNGDSIACRIDSITDSRVYFEMKYRNNWTHTEINTSECIEYKRNVINSESFRFIPGTSYINRKKEGAYSIYARNRQKNSIYGTIGYLGLYGDAGGNYERLIWEPHKGLFKSVWFRVGGAWYSQWGSKGTFLLSGVTVLTGLNNRHIEINMGITSMFDKLSYDMEVRNFPETAKSAYRQFFPSFGLGYRYQKPDGNFLFRTGIAIPEAAYLSLGFCF